MSDPAIVGDRGPQPARRTRSLVLRNHDPTRKLDLRLLRRIFRTLLVEILDRTQFQLELHLVGSEEIARLNEAYIHHRGVTDVIAFDYRDPGDDTLRGEIFVCLSEAIIQARRFRTTWQNEVVRYIVHGTLHLVGYDDLTAARRGVMKRAENAALRQLATRYDLPRLSLTKEDRE